MTTPVEIAETAQKIIGRLGELFLALAAARWEDASDAGDDVYAMADDLQAAVSQLYADMTEPAI